MLREYELVEIFTDEPTGLEDEYKVAQKEITGLNANPTYIVLDQKSGLEITRSDYTTNYEAFHAFVERGLTGPPVFRSVLRYEGIDRVENGKRYAVLEFDGSVEASPGIKVGQQEVFGSSGTLEMVDKMAYTGSFNAKQKFRIPAGLASGQYTIRAKLIGQIWMGEKFVTVDSATAKFQLDIVAASSESAKR